MSHHTEAFTDDDGLWGWQCFNPECHEEECGYERLADAEAAADEHEQSEADR